MSLLASGLSQLRHAIGWSNSSSAWQERLIGLAFVLSAAVLIYLNLTWLDLWQAAIVWGVYGLALAVCTRQGWLKLFGPVLFYDMIRTSRRSRYVVMRLLYAGLLLFILSMMYLNLEARHFAMNNRNDRRDMAMLAELFFSIFLLVQLAVVVLLTPAYVAGAIAEEKDRKTLEFLLATDLRNREIVLSKLLSRLANMALLLLTGLPILSILQFIGGVDQQLVLAGFAATGLGMLGLASVSILCSTLFKKPRDAIGLTYLCIVAYVALGAVGLSMEGARHPLMTEKICNIEGAPTFKEVSDVVNAGNPLAAIVDVIMAIEGRSRAGAPTNLSAELPGILRRFAYFHLPLALICILWSIARLRAIALKQTPAGTTAKLGWWQRRNRPAVSEMPMLWKELYIEGGSKISWLSVLAVFVLVLLTIGSGLIVLGDNLWRLSFTEFYSWNMLAGSMNLWYRVAGTGVACLTILSVAVRASTCISSERERDTFDALIATPMSADAMLGAKVLGALTSLRLGWLWLGMMLLMAIFTGGIHWLAVPFLLGALFVYALFFAMIGVWFSLIAKSSMRATVFTVLTTLGLSAGHWLLTGLCCMPVFYLLPFERAGDFPDYLMKFQAGMTPPFVLAWCAFSWDNLTSHWGRNGYGEGLTFCMVGLFLWGVACVILWFGILVPKFRQIARREELIYQ